MSKPCNHISTCPVCKPRIPRDVLAELRAVNVERSEKAFGHKLHDWSEPEWSNAIAGEVGELCNLVKKRHRGETSTNTVEMAAKEMADVVIYLDLLAARMGIDLRAAIVAKFNEVSERRGCPIKIPEFRR